jgi:Tol biopolymer transport system component
MSLIRFGEFRADARTEELFRDGRRVRLPRQSFQILMALTRVPGELVTRETLQAQLWPATSQVEWEQGLNAAINRLREALGDSAATPKYIETLPRRGYRFIGRLEQEPAPTRSPAPKLLTTRSRPRLWPIFAGAGTLVAAAILAFAVWRLRAPSIATPNVVPLTTLPGEERAPSFSPDGSRVVFAWNGGDSNGRFDLYVKALDSERMLRVTEVPSVGLSPAWSPDGNSIAFVRQLPDRDGVFIVPALGGPERRVASASLADPPFLQVAWSPDGRTLAYSTYDGESHVIRFVDVTTLGTYSLQQAPECWHTGLPAYSANGKRLAFVCTTSVGVYGVFIVDDGGVPERRATILGEPRGLAWDADQSHLILANDAGDGGGLWRLAPDGSLTRLPFGEEGSAPVRVGDRVAYVRGRQAVEIWRMDLTAPDPAASARRLIASTRVETTPQYSPDGQLIAFQSSRSGSTEVWMASAEGGDPVRLTHFNGPMTGAPRWCSDGRRVVLDSRAAGQAGLYVVDVDERRPRHIGDDVQLALPEWSPDCTKIIASDGRTRLFILPATGGVPAPFTERPSYYAQVTGDRVIFNVKQVDRVALWQKPITGGEEGALPGMPLLDYNDAWAVSDAGVYFTSDDAPSADAGPTRLNFYDFAARSVRRLAALPQAPAPGGGLGLNVSRDGRLVLYTQRGVAESDLMITTALETPLGEARAGE